MRERWALFESTALGDDKLEVRSIDGIDELNQLFRFDVVLVRPGLVSAIDEVLPALEKPASLWFEEDGKVFGEVHGIVAEASVSVDEEASFSLVRLQLVPRAWLLTQRRGDQIALDRTIPEILVEKLQAIGLVRAEELVLSGRRRAYTVFGAPTASAPAAGMLDQQTINAIMDVWWAARSETP